MQSNKSELFSDPTILEPKLITYPIAGLNDRGNIIYMFGLLFARTLKAFHWLYFLIQQTFHDGQLPR